MRGLCLVIMLVVFCVIYVNAVPPGSRVRRGFNNSGGYGGDRGSGSGGGYYNDDRDASVSRESGGDGGGECDHEESNESREHTYGDREEYGQRHDDRHHGGGRHPR